MSIETRRRVILELVERFHRPEFLVWDPLSVVRNFQGSADQEYVALVAALFAFGGVKQIIASLQMALDRLEIRESPGILKRSPDDLEARLRGFRHRIYVDRDLVHLTLLYQQSCRSFGSLRQHFEAHHSVNAPTMGSALAGVIRDYRQWSGQHPHSPGAHFGHMLNSPEGGSTCKRWLMFLKWMIRADDGIDLGLWSGSACFRTDQLLIPLDTHLFKISRKLGLTQRRTANWDSALEVTDQLKRIDPGDPTRFDFALCRSGMLDYRGLLGYADSR